MVAEQSSIFMNESDIDEAARNRREPNITFLMLAEMFGEDESASKLALSQIRKLTRKKNELLKPSHIIDKDIRWVVDNLNELEAEPIDSQIKFYRNFLNATDPKKKKEMDSRRVSEFDKERAREYPIVELLESFGVLFVRDFAVCPWHSERTASLHYIKARNTAYCQGCHKHVDSIAVVQHFRNVDFVEAVKSLI